MTTIYALNVFIFLDVKMIQLFAIYSLLMRKYLSTDFFVLRKINWTIFVVFDCFILQTKNFILKYRKRINQKYFRGRFLEITYTKTSSILHLVIPVLLLNTCIKHDVEILIDSFSRECFIINRGRMCVEWKKKTNLLNEIYLENMWFDYKQNNKMIHSFQYKKISSLKSFKSKRIKGS